MIVEEKIIIKQFPIILHFQLSHSLNLITRTWLLMSVRLLTFLSSMTTNIQCLLIRVYCFRHKDTILLRQFLSVFRHKKPQTDTCILHQLVGKPFQPIGISVQLRIIRFEEFNHFWAKSAPYWETVRPPKGWRPKNQDKTPHSSVLRDLDWRLSRDKR